MERGGLEPVIVRTWRTRARARSWLCERLDCHPHEVVSRHCHRRQRGVQTCVAWRGRDREVRLLQQPQVFEAVQGDEERVAAERIQAGVGRPILGLRRAQGQELRGSRKGGMKGRVEGLKGQYSGRDFMGRSTGTQLMTSRVWAPRQQHTIHAGSMAQHAGSVTDMQAKSIQAWRHSARRARAHLPDLLPGRHQPVHKTEGLLPDLPDAVGTGEGGGVQDDA